MTRAADYTRLSQDQDGTSTACARQHQDSIAYHTQQGWETVDSFTDNDISAYNRKKKRPDFERMLHVIESGAVDVITIYRSDRLARQPKDLERFLDACEAHKVRLVSLTEPEFGGVAGLMILRLLVNLANYESGVKAERVARRLLADAEQGIPHNGGTRAFGYTSAHEPHPLEAPVVREVVGRVLAGESLRAVSCDLNHRGILTVTGKLWRTGNFHRTLTSPKYAGLRVHKGVIRTGTWEPIIDRTRWEQLQAVLTSNYRPNEVRIRRHLLTGLVVCGRCGNKLNCTRIKVRGGTTTFAYRCAMDPPTQPGCGLSMRKHRLEGIILERFFHVVTTDAFTSLLAQAEHGQTMTAGLLSELAEDEAALGQLDKDHYVERTMSRPRYQAASAELTARIERARARIAKESSPIHQIPTDPEQLRTEWERRDIVWQRSVLEVLVEKITLAPTGHDRYLDRVAVTWKA